MSSKIYAIPIKQYAYDIQFYNISLCMICYHLKFRLRNGYVLCDTYEFQWQICIFRKFHEFFLLLFCFTVFFLFAYFNLNGSSYIILFISFGHFYFQVGRYYMSVVTFMWCWYCSGLFGGWYIAILSIFFISNVGMIFGVNITRIFAMHIFQRLRLPNDRI